jgi:hypothetical protein
MKSLATSSFCDNKRGSSHFEMIIGFVFFMGFVFFLFMTISPWDSFSLPHSALNELYEALEGEVGIELSTVFLKVNQAEAPVVNDCFYIDLPEELFGQDLNGGKSYVTLLGGVPINSDLKIPDIGDEGLYVRDRNEEFFRVVLSDEFTDDVVSTCDTLNDFELGGVVDIEVFSNKSLVAMRNSYYSDYAGLKTQLGVAPIFNFAIVVDGMPELNMEPPSGVPDGLEVLAKDYVVKVVNNMGYVSNERISLRIW